jgi:WD repeat-containing protein 45
VLQDHVFIYNFMDLKLVLQIDTAPNPRGLCCLCASAKNPVVACPGASKGEVRARRRLLPAHPPTLCQVRIELLSQRKTALVAAHDNQLAALALAHDGSKLATASQKGTIVRIFDCATALPLRELRRGSTSASLYVNRSSSH